MIELDDLARVHDEYAEDLAAVVEPVGLGSVTIGGGPPTVMGIVNLSPDSTYRESVAETTHAAVRRVRTLVAQGAEVVDLGAEASHATAERVGPDEQLERLLPVVGAVHRTVVLSVETYQPDVVEGVLAEGARIINLTGREGEDEMLDSVARHDAAVILCFGETANVHEPDDQPLEGDPLDALVEHFEPRIQRARDLGVTRIMVDPATGFAYANLDDPLERIRHQARVLTQTFRLRRLGVPVCNALPHAIEIFEDEYRTAEGFFTILATLGRTDLLRTHEVPRIRTVLDALRLLDVS